jgi:hypothetical protein
MKFEGKVSDGFGRFRCKSGVPADLPKAWVACDQNGIDGIGHGTLASSTTIKKFFNSIYAAFLAGYNRNLDHSVPYFAHVTYNP